MTSPEEYYEDLFPRFEEEIRAVINGSYSLDLLLSQVEEYLGDYPDIDGSYPSIICDWLVEEIEYQSRH
ncbi:MAG: hypothetical protein U0M61_07110 [Succinivibrio sp.]|nr:hypothetical protein [Succinivibrio sp.]